MLVGFALGDVISFRPEKNGYVVQNVVPVPGMESFQGNMGSNDLSFHTEYPFYVCRPDFVILLCLRPDREQRSTFRVASARQLLPLLSDREKYDLFTADFESSSPGAFGYETKASLRHSVFSGAPSDPDLRVDTATIKPLTSAAEAGLRRLEQLMRDTAHSASLAPGDLVIVDNRVAAHGRTAFRAFNDGHDRWLQRIFVTIDPRPSRPYRQRDGQVIDG